MNLIKNIRKLEIIIVLFIIISNVFLFFNFSLYSEENKSLKNINNLLFRYVDREGNYFYFYIYKIDDNEIRIDKLSYNKEIIKEISYIIIDINKKIIKEYNSDSYVYDKEKGIFSDKVFNISYKYNQVNNYLILNYDEYKNNTRIRKEEKINLGKNIFFLFSLTGISGDIFFYFLNFNNYKNIKEKISFLFFNKFFDATIQQNKDNKTYLFLPYEKERFYKSLSLNNISFETKDIYELSFYFEGFIKLYLKNIDFFVINFDKIYFNKKNLQLNNLNVFGGYRMKDKEKDNIFIIDYIAEIDENYFLDILEKVKKIEK